MTNTISIAERFNLNISPITYLGYAKDGNTVVKHRAKARHLINDFYIGELQYNDFGDQYFNCYISKNEVTTIIIENQNFSEIMTDEFLIKSLKEKNIPTTAEGYIAYIIENKKQGRFIRKLEIDFVSAFDKTLGFELAKYRDNFIKAQEEEDRKKQIKEAEDEKLYCDKLNEETDLKIQQAIQVLKTSGIIKNEYVSFYENDRYTHKDYKIINYLARKYGITIPMKTQGWINSSLEVITIKDNKMVLYQTSGSKTQTIFKWVDKLCKTVLYDE